MQPTSGEKGNIYKRSDGKVFMNNYFTWSQNRGIDVSSHGEHPYSLFSPFACNKESPIPVPGNEQIRAYSVEGIWQGLKIINGKTDESLFSRNPKKRKGSVEGHFFGTKVLDYLTARKQIYVPAYVYHAVHNALPHNARDLERMIKISDVAMHDVEKNGNIQDVTKPLAHSAVLVTLLNVLINAPIPPFSQDRFESLHQQVDALSDYRAQLRDDDRAILDEVVTFAYLFSPDPLQQTCALRTIKKEDLSRERLSRYRPIPETAQPYQECF